jgi:hypothetical protein
VVTEELLYHLDLWLIFLASMAFFLVVIEMSFRLGRRALSNLPQGEISELTTIQGAMLGLLAPLLGFTFSMAITRFEARKQLVLDEANAIGTTFLRAQILPEPARQEISGLLRRYIEVRLESSQYHLDQEKIRRLAETTDQLQRQLWSQATAVGEREPRSVPAGLFISSLNEVIDLYAKQLVALENHVPEIIIILLYFIAISAFGLIGYSSGAGGRRNFCMTFIASFAIAAVILVIIDLDRPHRGLIKVSQKQMTELRHSLANY